MRALRSGLVSPLLITTSIGLLACAGEEPATGPSAEPVEATAAATMYSRVNLGTLGGDRSMALDINRTGLVVGWSSLSSPGTQRPFRWKSGVMTALGTLGGTSGVATAVNDAGIIVGWSISKSGNRRATRWGDGKIKNLGTLGGLESEAADVSPSGVIVGWAENAAGAARAFLWKDGVMQDLGTLGGGLSRATGINRAGVVVGYSHTASGHTHAFRWKDGAMQDLGNMGRRSSAANALNNQGIIVGTVGPKPDADEEESDVADLFIWNKGTVTLRHAGAPFFSSAEDVNAAGTVVGTTSDFTDDDFSDAFVIEGGVAAVLDGVGGGAGPILAGANAINAAGDIVGFRGPMVQDGGYTGIRATLWRRQR
jgi:probable HAF family extracellular repeat protein